MKKNRKESKKIVVSAKDRECVLFEATDGVEKNRTRRWNLAGLHELVCIYYRFEWGLTVARHPCSTLNEISEATASVGRDRRSWVVCVSYQLTCRVRTAP